MLVDRRRVFNLKIRAHTYLYVRTLFRSVQIFARQINKHKHLPFLTSECRLNSFLLFQCKHKVEKNYLTCDEIMVLAILYSYCMSSWFYKLRKFRYEIIFIPWFGDYAGIVLFPFLLLDRIHNTNSWQASIPTLSVIR